MLLYRFTCISTTLDTDNRSRKNTPVVNGIKLSKKSNNCFGFSYLHEFEWLVILGVQELQYQSNYAIINQLCEEKICQLLSTTPI